MTPLRSARRKRVPALLAALPLLATSLGAATLALAADPAPAPAAAAAGDPVVIAGGDIACRPGRASTATTCQHQATANLVNSLNPAVVLPLGDTQYDSGTTSEYAASYNPTWGTFLPSSRPAVGNHEYRTAGASGYYGYFGARAGDPAKGYYSYDVQGPTFTWHLVSLNTECTQVAGCGVGSPQETWLRQDLAANRNKCILAYSHRPRFSSGGVVGSSSSVSPLFQALYDGGADLFLSGHAHHYERFRPQTAAGASDPTRGVTQFVVGTAGDDFQSLGTTQANSLVRQNNQFGVLKLTLHANSYDYAFAPAAGYAFNDSGTATCHNAPASDTTPPSQPTNLSASASSPNQVSLSWTASTDNVGVRGYRILRGPNDSSLVEIATTTTSATTYTDPSVQAATPYTYRVVALDAAGNASAPSAPASVTTPATSDTSPPTAPTLSAESIAANEVALGWTTSTDTGTGVSGYRVYRQPDGASTSTLVATTPTATTRYVDNTVLPNTRYTYQVEAFDGAGNKSAKSNAVVVTTPPGPTTATYTATLVGDATLDATNPTVNAGASTRLVVDNSPVNDFLLRFSRPTGSCNEVTSATLKLVSADGSNRGGDFYTTGATWAEGTVTWDNAPARGALLNSLGAVSTTNTYTVDVTQGVTTAGGDIAFRVASTSSDGARYYSKEDPNTVARPQLTIVCTNSSTDTQPPTAPESVTATATSSTTIDVSWAAATDNVGVTGYQVFRNGSTTPLATVSGTSTSWQDSTVVPGTTYSYRVGAFDASNNKGPLSAAASATTPTTASTAPPGNLAAAATGSTSIDVTWTASPTAGVTDYRVYRGAGQIATVPSSTSPLRYADTGLTPATSYSYTVTAVAGGVESAKPAAVSATTSSGTPPPTTGIAVRNVKTTTVTAAGTSWTVGLPAFQAGDVVALWLGNNVGSTAKTPTAPGWTNRLMINESSGLKGSWLTRTMAAGDPATVTVTWGTATLGVAHAAALTGVDGANPVSGAAGSAEPSSTAVTAHSTPALSTTVSGTVLLSGFTTNNASTWTSPDPELADTASGSAVSAALYASAPLPPASYSRTGTATTGSVKAVSTVLALRPAGGAQVTAAPSRAAQIAEFGA